MAKYLIFNVIDAVYLHGFRRYIIDRQGSFEVSDKLFLVVGAGSYISSDIDTYIDDSINYNPMWGRRTAFSKEVMIFNTLDSIRDFVLSWFSTHSRAFFGTAEESAYHANRFSCGVTIDCFEIHSVDEVGNIIESCSLRVAER